MMMKSLFLLSRVRRSPPSPVVRTHSTLTEIFHPAGHPPHNTTNNDSSGGGGGLYSRLSALGAKPDKTVAQTLNAYIREGKVAKKFELERCVRELRRYGRYQHALEVIDWMEKRNINLSHKDFALRLDLVAKTQGLIAAESYFSGLPPSAKNLYTYGALLNSYCQGKMVDKALALFQKMDEMNFVSGLSYSNLMSLHMSLGQYEKVPQLVQEMKNRNILLNTMSYNLWMTSLSCVSDIEGVEKVFEEIKMEVRDWTTYSNLAAIYMKAGHHEKAKETLQILEKHIKPSNREPYHFIISLYSGISNLDEVYRVWEILKSSFNTTANKSYLVMIQALSKLNDIDGLKKCYQEWEATYSSYDLRIANSAIAAFLKNDKIEEAELVFREAVKKSNSPFYRTWGLFVTYYLKKHDTDMAMKCMEAAASEAKNKEWGPSPETVEAFMNCFQAKKDVESAEKLCTILRKMNRLDEKTYILLLRTYIVVGKTDTELRRRVEEDEIQISFELEDLLRKVCPE